MKDVVKPYADAMTRFVDKEISAQQFEDEYLELFRNETELIEGEEHEILDEAYFFVDEYVSDPELRSRGGGLDDAELYASVKRCRDRLLDLDRNFN